jgi:hypothetical protein
MRLSNLVGSGQFLFNRLRLEYLDLYSLNSIHWKNGSAAEYRIITSMKVRLAGRPL